MRVGFVLRSAEIKPLVPKICALFFLQTKRHSHLTPPPPQTTQHNTTQPPPKLLSGEEVCLHINTSGLALKHDARHLNDLLVRGFFSQRLKDLNEKQNATKKWTSRKKRQRFKTFFSRLQDLDEKRPSAMGCHGLLPWARHRLLPSPACHGRPAGGKQSLVLYFFYFLYIHVSHGHFTLAFYILPGWPFKTNIAQNIYFRVVLLNKHFLITVCLLYK